MGLFFVVRQFIPSSSAHYCLSFQGSCVLPRRVNGLVIPGGYKEKGPAFCRARSFSGPSVPIRRVSIIRPVADHFLTCPGGGCRC